jgi:hypothetical protein
MWTENDRKEARDAWQRIADECRILQRRADELARSHDHTDNTCYAGCCNHAACFAESCAEQVMDTREGPCVNE